MYNSNNKEQADQIYKNMVNAKWYKKYIRLVETDIDVTNYRVIEKRVIDIVSLIGSDVEVLGYGLNRLVTRQGDFAIKLLIYWNSGTIRERDLIRHLEYHKLNSLLEHLCPMFVNNDYVAVCSFCEKYKVPTNEVHDTIDGSVTLLGNEVDSILRAFNNSAIQLDDMTKAEQWGRLNGKLVLLDYEDYIILN